MGFRKYTYAKVWEIRPSNESATTDIKISVSRKNRDTGEYLPDFSGYVRCIGTANTKARTELSEGDRIKMGDVDVSSWYNKDTDRGGYIFKMFTFEMADSPKAPDNSEDYPFTSTEEVDSNDVDEDDDNPF